METGVVQNSEGRIINVVSYLPEVVWRVNNYYLLEYFLMVFLFVLFFWESYDSNAVAFNIVLEVFEIVFISFNSFFFFPL